MTERTPWDVVIVGAGPAGAAAAAHLCRAGWRVLLLDRDHFPRAKPCGDCVNPAAVRELATLGVLSRVRAEPHAPLRGWQIACSGDAFRARFSGAEGIAIGRERLDRVLLEHAVETGASVRTGERVVDLERGAGGRVVGVRLAGGEVVRARLVVGADGLRSVVVRRLGLLARRPRVRKIALTGRVKGIRGLADRGELHVHGGVTIGIAPIGEGMANVTVVLSGEATGGVRAGSDVRYDVAIAEVLSGRGGAREGEVLATGPFDWPVRSAVADGALLVGDAAGYFDPFTGQGIYRALRGAAAAAAAATRALARDDLRAIALLDYERDRRRLFRPGERLQRVIDHFLTRELAFRGAVAILRARPEVADTLVAVTGDLLPVRALWSARTLKRLVA